MSYREKFTAKEACLLLSLIAEQPFDVFCRYNSNGSIVNSLYQIAHSRGVANRSHTIRKGIDFFLFNPKPL